MLLADKALPYPILDNSDPNRDDYFTGRYICALENPGNEPNETNEVQFIFQHDCDVPELKNLIRDGHARYCVLVTCSDTLYRQAFLCAEPNQVISLNIYKLHGKVEFQPQIVAINDISQYSSESLHEEFGDYSFDLKPGDVLAVDDSVLQFLEFNQLKFETLITVRLAETIDPLSYRIDLNKNYIYILMGKNLWHLWNELRYEQDKRPFLAMSIYKDCFLVALEELQANFEEISETRWARALVQKVAELELEIPDSKDLNEMNLIAQKIIEDESVKKLLVDRGE